MIVSCHSPHTRCGVREYGLQLDRAFSDVGASVLGLSYHEHQRAIDTAGPGNVLLVHFEPSLFSGTYFHVLQQARAKGSKVVFCCHHYDPTLVHGPAANADAIVTHRDPEHIIHHQQSVIPLGCPVYTPREDMRPALRARLGLPEDKIVVTTVGFLAQWKKTPDVIEALLRALPPDAFLQVHTPYPFDPGQAPAEEARIRQIFGARRGGSAFSGGNSLPYSFSTEFLPDHELLDRVYASDVGFVYHGLHTKSVSAATKAFISGRCPVVVTNSTHASDMKEGIFHVGSFDINHFAQGVAAVAKDTNLRAALRRGAEREYERLNMHVVAKQYIDLFRRLGCTP